MGKSEKSRRDLDPGGEQRLIRSLRAAIILLPIGCIVPMTEIYAKVDLQHKEPGNTSHAP